MCIRATGRHTGMTIHAGSHFWYHRQRQRQRQTETFCKRPGGSEWWLPVPYQTLPCYTLAIKAVVRKEQTVCDDQWIDSILISAVLVSRLDSTADIPIVSMSARFLDQCLCLQYFIARSESYSLCCSCFQAWWFRSAVLASAELLRFLLALYGFNMLLLELSAVVCVAVVSKRDGSDQQFLHQQSCCGSCLRKMWLDGKLYSMDSQAWVCK